MSFGGFGLIESAAPVDSGTKHTVAYLIANLSLRVPKTIQAIGGNVLNAMEQADNLLKAQMKHFDDTGTTPPSPSGFDRDPSSHRYTPEEWELELQSLREEVASGKPMLAYTMRLIPHLVPLIESMSWVVLAAPRDRYFLTSDNPVVLTLFDGSVVGAGWGRADTLATLPLSPGHLLTTLYSNEASARRMYVYSISGRLVTPGWKCTVPKRIHLLRSGWRSRLFPTRNYIDSPTYA